MTRAHRVLSVAAALALVVFNPASSAPADPGAVPILAKDLPVQLNLPDNSGC